MNRKNVDLGTGPVGKLLFSLALPTITSQIVNMLYNLVDRVYIGHMQPVETVGKLALTGVGVCLPIIMVISAFAALLAMGGAPRASIEEGRGNSGEAERIMGNCFAMLVWTQSTSILAIYAETSVNRNLFGFEITPAAFQTLPAVLAIFWGMVVTALWTKLGKKQPSAPAKIGVGTMLWGAGPLFMILPFVLYEPGVKVSPLWLVIFYVLIILGEAFTSPVGYSSASMVAPKAFATQMMTVWSLSQSTGAALSTLAVNFYKEGSEATYFLLIGGITVVVGLVVLLLAKKLEKGMGLKD